MEYTTIHKANIDLLKKHQHMKIDTRGENFLRNFYTLSSDDYTVASLTEALKVARDHGVPFNNDEQAIFYWIGTGRITCDLTKIIDLNTHVRVHQQENISSVMNEIYRLEALTEKRSA
jgi:hypothetical protein